MSTDIKAPRRAINWHWHLLEVVDRVGRGYGRHVWQEWDAFRAQQAGTTTIGRSIVALHGTSGKWGWLSIFETHRMCQTNHGSRFSWVLCKKTKAQTNTNTNGYYFYRLLWLLCPTSLPRLTLLNLDLPSPPKGFLLYRGSRPKKGPSEC
ncbi:hypothetical protein K457DRAFT_841666 [Linnemannia elongata AG-77]|uniref:Uncharacterized protein n=1 Tax=Linnemannia elongata AG-77 TaxID=1314771 RepID=A0A197JJ47_9FUNG|nr:hypothetical protein K457DRAFT_841666 [Linnemannia elongata AG-77]